MNSLLNIEVKRVLHSSYLQNYNFIFAETIFLIFMHNVFHQFII